MIGEVLGLVRAWEDIPAFYDTLQRSCPTKLSQEMLPFSDSVAVWIYMLIGYWRSFYVSGSLSWAFEISSCYVQQVARTLSVRLGLRCMTLCFRCKEGGVLFPIRGLHFVWLSLLV